MAGFTWRLLPWLVRLSAASKLSWSNMQFQMKEETCLRFDACFKDKLSVLVHPNMQSIMQLRTCLTQDILQ